MEKRAHAHGGVLNRVASRADPACLHQAVTYIPILDPCSPHHFFSKPQCLDFINVSVTFESIEARRHIFSKLNQLAHGLNPFFREIFKVQLYFPHSDTMSHHWCPNSTLGVDPKHIFVEVPKNNSPQVPSQGKRWYDSA